MGYPEQLLTSPDVLFMNALQDAGMVGPKQSAVDTPGLLFVANVFTIKLGGDSGLNDANGTLSLPLETIYITIGGHYGESMEWCARDDSSTAPVAVGDIQIPFTVWGSSAQDLDDARPRLYFARDHRRDIFSAHGLTLQGKMIPERRRGLDPKMGLFAEDYRWRFYWERI